VTVLERPTVPAFAHTPINATRPLAIVVADDVVEIQQLVGQWLKALGHTVTCASTGREVLRIIKLQHVDVIVADVLMPDGDALDILDAVKKMPSAPRVLAISGGGKYMTGPECLRVAKSLGADAILLKPFNREQLLEAVKKVSST
jgi:CheY-like chemotaxis protein